MRLLLALLLLPWLVGCSELADHRRVPAKTLAKMDADALTKEQFLQQMSRKNIRHTRPVTLPFRLVGGVPVVKAAINGQAFTPMMYDTGASRTIIQASTAVSHGVSVLNAEAATVQLQGVVGREEGRIGLLNPLVIGDWTLNGYPCLVRTFENRVVHSTFPKSLLGFDLAHRHCTYLTLDYRTQHITFGFGAAFKPQAQTRKAQAPFTVKHGVPHIILKSGDKSWEAIVDSGSFNGIEISEEVAKRLGVQDQGETIHGMYLMGVGGTVSSRQANLRTVKLPDLTLIGDRFAQAEVDISPGPPRVGSFFLKDYRVTFDLKRKVLHLEW